MGASNFTSILDAAEQRLDSRPTTAKPKKKSFDEILDAAERRLDEAAHAKAQEGATPEQIVRETQRQARARLPQPQETGIVQKALGKLAEAESGVAETFGRTVATPEEPTPEQAREELAGDTGATEEAKQRLEKIGQARALARDVNARVDEQLAAHKPVKATRMAFRGLQVPVADPELERLNLSKKILSRVDAMNPENTGFVQGLKRAAKEPERLIPFVGSLVEAGELLEVLRITRKEERGEKLTGGEDAVVDSYAAMLQAAQNFSPGILDRAAEVAVGIPAFALEFAGTAGLYSTTKEGAKKLLSKLATRSVAEKLKGTVATKIAEKAVTSAVGGAAQAAVLPGLVTETVRRQLPKLGVETNQTTGNLARRLDGKGEDFVEALTKAYGLSAVEAISERTGGLVQQPLEALKKQVLARWIRQKGGVTATEAALTKLAERAGWNGIVGEVFEEQVAKPFRSAIEDQPLTEDFTLENLAVESLGFTLFGGAAKGFGYGVGRAGDLVEKRLQRQFPQLGEEPVKGQAGRKETVPERPVSAKPRPTAKVERPQPTVAPEPKAEAPPVPAVEAPAAPAAEARPSRHITIPEAEIARPAPPEREERTAEVPPQPELAGETVATEQLRRDQFRKRVAGLEARSQQLINQISRGRKKFGTTAAERELAEITKQIDEIYRTEFPGLQKPLPEPRPAPELAKPEAPAVVRPPFGRPPAERPPVPARAEAPEAPGQVEPAAGRLPSLPKAEEASPLQQIVEYEPKALSNLPDDILGGLYRDYVSMRDYRISAYPSKETLTKYSEFARSVLSGNDPLSTPEQFSRFVKLRTEGSRAGLDLGAVRKAFLADEKKPSTSQKPAAPRVPFGSAQPKAEAAPREERLDKALDAFLRDKGGVEGNRETAGDLAESFVESNRNTDLVPEGEYGDTVTEVREKIKAWMDKEAEKLIAAKSEKEAAPPKPKVPFGTPQVPSTITSPLGVKPKPGNEPTKLPEYPDYIAGNEGQGGFDKWVRTQKIGAEDFERKYMQGFRGEPKPEYFKNSYHRWAYQAGLLDAGKEIAPTKPAVPFGTKAKPTIEEEAAIGKYPEGIEVKVSREEAEDFIRRRIRTSTNAEDMSGVMSDLRYPQVVRVAASERLNELRRTTPKRTEEEKRKAEDRGRAFLEGLEAKAAEVLGPPPAKLGAPFGTKKPFRGGPAYDRAHEAGKAAFARGDRRFVGLDNKFIEWVKSGVHNASIMDLQEEWYRGWDAANIAAPVPTTVTPSKAEEVQEIESRIPALIDRFEAAIRDKTMPTDPRDVRELARQTVGGDPAQYVDDIYDALEGATNRALRDERTGDLSERIKVAAKFEDALGRRTRTIEITKRQQFSTPLPIAEGVAYAADVQRGDKILEPTAGTGNLIEPFVEPNGYRNGATVKAIEIEPRRAEVLRANGFDTEQADYIRTKENADVVVTNPPWGKISTGRYAALDVPAPWGKYGDVSERFFVKNLNDVNEGGRVVALMPTTVLGPESIGFRKWLEKNHTVRAWIQSPPGAYTRRGTDVESILLVVDKGKVSSPSRLRSDWGQGTEIVERWSSAALTGQLGVGVTLDKAAVAQTLKTGDAVAETVRDVLGQEGAKSEMRDFESSRKSVPSYLSDDIPQSQGESLMRLAKTLEDWDGARGTPNDQHNQRVLMLSVPRMQRLLRNAVLYGKGEVLTGALLPIKALDTNAPKDYVEYAKAIQPLGEGGSHARIQREATTSGTRPEAPLGTGYPVRPPQPIQQRPGGGEGLPPERIIREGSGELRPEGAGPSPVLVPEPTAGITEQPGPAAAPRLVRQGARALRPERVAPERLAEYDAAANSDIFAPYAVRSGVRGSPHPRQVVETRSLAGAPAPELTYKPSDGVMAAHAKGVISDEQVDAVAAAGQANRAGHAIMVADDVGLGKSREIGARGMDLIEQEGKKRILITSKGEANLRDLEQELKILWDIPADSRLPVRYLYLRDFKDSSERGNKTKEWQPLPTFSEPTIYVVESTNLTAFRRAITTLQVDAVLADEVHTYKNIEDSMVGESWKNLHRDWLARKVPIAYYSATPATMVDELEYLYGLREWSIDGFPDWIMLRTGRATEAELQRAREELQSDRERRGETAPPLDVGAMGTDASDIGPTDRPVFRRGDIFSSPVTTAEMEQIMRELKMGGKYMARDLWRGGVEFEQIDIPLTPEESARYRTLVKFIRDVEETYSRYAAMNQNRSRFGPSSAFQFHAKRALFDMRLDRAIEKAEEAVANGEQPIISVISVSEILEGKGNLYSVIEGINTQHVLVDGDTGEIEDLGEIPEAVAAINELLERYRVEVPPSPDPIEKIYKAFGGRGKVAAITGRDPVPVRRKEMELFQSGQKKVAIISAAGKIGINLHHVKFTKGGERGRRNLIVADYEWSAMTFKQEMGRGDRAGQLTSPKIKMLTMGMAGEKKFVATIANRLKAQGAVSKGAGESGTAEPLEHYEIGGDYDNLAMRETWANMSQDLRSLFRGSKFMERLDDGSLVPRRRTEADVKDFMLQLQLVPVEEGNEIWNMFWETRERLMTGESAEERELRKTQKSTGIITREHELKPDLTLYEVKDAAGHRAGILVGMITDKMGVLRDFLMPEGARTPRREYVQFRAEDGTQLSGLRVPPGMVKPLAQAFGKKITYKHTAAGALVDLRAGDKIPLANDWELRVGKAGEREDFIIIEGAKLGNTERGKTIQPYGAGYNPVSGGFFHLGKIDAAGAADRIQKFLERFPIKTELAKETGTKPPEKPEEGGDAETFAVEATPKRAGLPPFGRQRPVAEAGATGLRRGELLADIRKILDIPFGKGRFKQRALGVFKAFPWAIRTKFKDYVPVDAHELGHALNKYLWGVDSKQRVEIAQFRPYRKELIGLVPENWPASRRNTREGFAEFIRHYLIDQEFARFEVPEFTEFFERELASRPELEDAIRSAQQKIQAYLGMTPEEKVKSDIIFGEEKRGRSFKEMLVWVNDFLFDEFGPLARATRLAFGARRVEDVPTEKNAYLLAEAFKNNQDKGRLLHFLKYGPLTWQLQPTGTRGLFDILEPLDSKERLEDFATYLVSRTAIDRLTAKPSMVLPQTKETYEKAIGRLEAKHSDFRDIAQEFDRWGDDALNYYAESGRPDPEVIDKIRAIHRHHVPLYRHSEQFEKRITSALGSRFAKVPNPLKRAKGGTELILNPVVSKVLNVAALINAADRWDVQRALVDLAKEPETADIIEEVNAKKYPITFNLQSVARAIQDATGLDLAEEELDVVAQIWRDQDPRGLPDNIIVDNREGKRKLYEIKDPELVKALNGLLPSEADWYVKLIGAVARTLRAGVVLPVDFVVRNVLRDQPTAAILSNRRYAPYVQLARGVSNIVKETEAYKEAVAQGLRHYGVQSLDRKTLDEFVRQQLRNKQGGLPYSVMVRHPLEAVAYLWDAVLGKVEDVGQAAEMASRLPEFTAARQEALARGETPRAASARAAFEAGRVTVNFSKVGWGMKAVAQMAAFFNPNLQGQKRVVEAHIQFPWRTMRRGLLYLTIPSILLYLLNRDDEEYQEFPLWRKLFFWHIPVHRLVGKNDVVNYVMIPKPWELGFFYGSLPEMVLSQVDKRNPAALEKIWEAFWESAMPDPRPTLLQAAWHQATGRDAFGRPIETEFEKGLEPEYRAKPWTPQVWKRIGGWMGMSPARLQQGWRDTTGTIGGYVEDLASKADDLVAGREEVEQAERRLSDLPFFRAFVAKTPGFGAESIQKFYDQLEEMEQAYRTARLPLKGREVDPEVIARAEREGILAVSARGEVIAGDRLQDFRDTQQYLRTLRTLVVDVQNDRQKSPQEKRQDLKRIEQEAVRSVRELLAQYRPTTRPPFGTQQRVEARP